MSEINLHTNRNTSSITPSSVYLVQGRSRYGVVPYVEAPPAKKRRAWKEIEKIQRKVGKTMQKKGLTEDDFDRLLQDEE